jgi:hypothetical protein
VYGPSSIYRDAGDAVAALLVASINDARESLVLNHLLLALAWTRSTVAEQTFRQWAVQRPEWASTLHVPPEEYLPNAGWCLDENGERRDLISLHCCRLARIDEEVKRAVRCRSRLKEKCPDCGSNLAWLFDFSEMDAHYFPGEFADAPRKIAFCSLCSCFAPVFTRYHADGTWEWIAGNGTTEDIRAQNLTPCIRAIDLFTSAPFACAEPFGLGDASSLGGIPMWLQDAEFPRCIECGGIMTFLAQHDNGALGEEGVYYAFFCARCHVAAVNYQQT